MPKYSIVMPVYGVEKFLPNAIQSVLAQTIHDYELILVDDESPDNCPKICDRYSEEYSHIKVIHQRNTGLAGARNNGFEHISGRYVYYLDSDDTIQPELLECFEKVLNEEPDTDFIFTNFQHVGENEQFKAATHNNGYCIYTDMFALQEKFLKRELKILAPGTLFNVEWCRRNNLKFLNNPFGEDQLFIFYSLLCANKVIHIKRTLYNYLTRQGSIMLASNYKKILKAYPFFIELSRVYYASDKASPLVKKYLLPRWCAGVCHSAAKNSTYREYKIFLEKVDADIYIPKLLGFPSVIIKVLSLMYMTSKKIYYIANGGVRMCE